MTLLTLQHPLTNNTHRLVLSCTYRPAKLPDAMKNCAFVFIKPHAVTDAVKKLTEETFKEKDITILSQGSL